MKYRIPEPGKKKLMPTLDFFFTCDRKHTYFFFAQPFHFNMGQFEKKQAQNLK